MRNVIVLSSLMALGLTGCMGGTTAPTIDMSAVTGTGTLADSYVMPLHMPAGTNGGMEDYLSQAGGVWKYNMFGPVRHNNTANLESLSKIVYDTVADTWTVTYTTSTTPFSTTLSYDSASDRYTNCGTVSCNELYLFDKSKTQSQYGTFGYTRDYVAPTSGDVDMHSYFMTGLATEIGNMPTYGTATYSGNFEATRIDVATGAYVQATGGTLTSTATFTGGGGSLSIDTVQAAVFSGTTDIYEISATATISGNTFVDTLSWGTWRTNTRAFVDNYQGALVGIFFGPSANEIAGTFQQTNVSGTSTVVGGIWAAK